MQALFQILFGVLHITSFKKIHPKQRKNERLLKEQMIKN